MDDQNIRAAIDRHWAVEFRDGKVSHETQYFADSFDAPTWRAQWVAPAP
jgi:hypothetical protein